MKQHFIIHVPHVVSFVCAHYRRQCGTTTRPLCSYRCWSSPDSTLQVTMRYLSLLFVCVSVCVTGGLWSRHYSICGHMMPLRNRHNSHEVIQIVNEAVCSSRCLCSCVSYGKTLDSSVRSHDVLQYNVGPVFVKLQYHI